MAGLMEVRTTQVHCYVDAHFTKQGEYREWDTSGRIREHSFYRNDKRHGEYKIWDKVGKLTQGFALMGEDITDEIKSVLGDISCITPEEQVFIRLKYDIECIDE